MKSLIVLFCIFMSSSLLAKEIREFMDLQFHATMFKPYPFFGKGFREISPKKEKRLKYRHQFRDVTYKKFFINNSGSRIIVNGAMAAEVAFTKKQAKRLIIKQIEYVDQFAKENSEHFAVARTPKEVRELVHNTNKTIIIHSIEGARKILNGPEDAKFWASKGVAFITLIHLFDDEFGKSAVNPDFIGKVINMPGAIQNHFHPGKKRGLTQKGKDAIKWIIDAGMLVDLTHMSPDSKDDALKIFEEIKAPPLLTHSAFKPIGNHDRGVSREQLIKIYQLGGLFSMPIDGNSHALHNAEEGLQKKAQDICEGSLESYLFAFNSLQDFLTSKLDVILGVENTVTFKELSEQQKVDLSIGWESDWNGWVNHSRPRFGKRGCYELKDGLSEVETRGLAHPGLLPQYWSVLEKEGMKTEVLKRASEKFLQMWKQVRKKSMN